MNDKLKITIKVDIIGPINGSSHQIINYNQIDSDSSEYNVKQRCPLQHQISCINNAVCNIERALQSMEIYGFTIVE